MAAPKRWGYTRDQDFSDELLVSWTDGDLTANVAKEVDERLLGRPESRREVAAFARAVVDSIGPELVEWTGKMPGSREQYLRWPRSGMVDTSVALAIHAGDWEGPGEPDVAGYDQAEKWSGIPMTRLRFGTIVPGAVFILVSVLLAFWMIKNL